jgi:RNA polymerase sigma factor (sigma-70 family)
VIRVVNSDQEQKFIRELNQHAGIVHRVCRIYFGDPADREDVYQEIIYQLWKSYPSFQGESKFSTWMYRVALNTAIGQLRKDKRTIAKEPLHDHLAEITPYQQSEAEERMKLLYSAINTLSLIDKAIILLYLEDNSYDEIAMVAGLTRTNVSVRLVRIKKKLEEKLKDNK